MRKLLVVSLNLIFMGSVLAITFDRVGPALGYGYGYGACTADRPNELTAEYVNNDRRIQFSWSAIEFEDCEDGTATYQIQVRKTDATLLQEYTGLTSTTKTISASGLQTNLAYKFRVRATASDDEETDWSLYKAFRTLPNEPTQLRIRKLSDSSAHISWKNIVRSKKLRYYQMTVKRGEHVVFSKRIKLGLRHNRTGATVTGLKSTVRYRVKVRAVARATSKSEFAKKYFRLD